jgi:hypothetical protein
MQRSSFYHFVVLIFALLLQGELFGKDRNTVNDERVLQVHNAFLDEAILLTKHCVGFSPPVSGRAFAYLTLGMYESTIDFLPNARSFSGQMNGYTRQSYAEGNKYNRALVALECDFALMNYFYRNMPPRSEIELQQLYLKYRLISQKTASKKVNLRSEELGKAIASEIIQWSQSDGGDNGFNENFPEDYSPPECLSCWTRTTPGYLTSLLPHWGKVRWMLPGSSSTYSGFEPPVFSTDTSSLLYKDAQSLLQNSKEIDPEYETIAEYWDDSPGYSGTPSGHFFSLARCLSKQKKLDLTRSIQLYAKLGIAMNEAYIAAWELKYSYHFIRPITYIQRYIEPQFNTRLATPPFPEYPSGHSYQSASGGEVFKHFFGDDVEFIDSTNSYRDDINGTPRSFTSFSELVQEVSMSRFYGGIHFRQTLDQSVLMGKELGRYVVEHLKCTK